MSAVTLDARLVTVEPEFTNPDTIVVTDPDGNAVVFTGNPDDLRELGDSIAALADELAAS